MSDADTFTSAYEVLRRQVLTDELADGSCGLQLLRQEGIAAWMLRRPSSPALEEPVRAQPMTLPAAAVFNEAHPDLVCVLASMVLAGAERRSVHGS